MNHPRRYSYEECRATADWLLAQMNVRPLVGIVCGSGLGGLAEMLKDQVAFNYKDIPNFPQSTGQCVLRYYDQQVHVLVFVVGCVCVFIVFYYIMF